MTRRCIGLFLLSIAGAAQAQDGADLLSAYRRAESYLPHNIVDRLRTADDGTLVGSAFGKHWRIESDTSIGEVAPTHEDSSAVSPDGRWEAFVRGGNLFLRQTSSGAERALTSDGTEQTFYARVRYLCRQPPRQVDAGE